MESYTAYERGLSVAKSSKVLADARSEALAAYHKHAKGMQERRKHKESRI